MAKIIIFLLSFFDFLHKRKIKNFLKKKNFDTFNIIFDIGAHKGESINFFLNYFSVSKIISFEASPENYKKLNSRLSSLIKKYKSTKIIIENIGLGHKEGIHKFNQLHESSSSTFNQINVNSNYYKKKNKILNFFSSQKSQKIININIIPLNKYIDENNIVNIDLIKIDTEGFEFDIIKGLNSKIDNVKLIIFEHHYDDMITKNYTFSHVNDLLVKNKFKKIFKIKMPFRKSFEYIYVNTKYS